jgi:hypothetical protein
MRNNQKWALIGSLMAGPLLGAAISANVADATPAIPIIRSVHFSDIGGNMRIEVDGSGFGAPSIGIPFVGDVGNFQFNDISRNESWGYNGDTNLQYASWTNTKIVVNGLTNYQTGQLMPGDQVNVTLATQANEGTQADWATWKGTLVSSPAPPPTPSEANPVISNVYITDIGPNMKIVVTGDGFGTSTIGLPFSGDVSNFQFNDDSRNESWGYNGDTNINYVSWSNQRIVVDNPQNYSSGQLVSGDQIDVWVQNAKSGEHWDWSGTLHNSAAAPSGSSAPTPTPTTKKTLALSSASISAGGKEIATVSIKPGQSASLIVDYPNDTEKLLGPTVAGSSGRVSFPWSVPAGVKGLVHVTLDVDGALTTANFTVS